MGTPRRLKTSTAAALPDSSSTVVYAADYFAAERLRWREKEFQAHVVRLAKDMGFKAYHSYFSDRSEAGFPDLVLVRERIVFVELKTMKGIATDKQMEWYRALCSAGAEAYIWRPDAWNSGEIAKVLG